MSKKDFPVQVVEIKSSDHRPPIEIKASGGKLFCDVTDQLRANLSSQVDQAAIYLHDQLVKWPELPAVVKVTLKEEALAKSHRPTSLLTRSTCPIIGTLDFGEILVSATINGLNNLSKKIRTTSARKPIANISAIEKIEPYRASDYWPEEKKSRINDWVEHQTPLKIHTFDHANQDINNKIDSALITLASELGIEMEKVHYGTRISAYKLIANNTSAAEKLESFIGLESFNPMPTYIPSDMDTQSSPVGKVDESLLPPPNQDEEYPIVGVIDSGVCPNSTHLSPWVIAKENYVPQSLQDNTHGTMVAGLIAGAASLNHQDSRFPSSQAKIVDVPVFEKGKSLDEDTLVSIIEDVVPKYPEVKVWNLSLGSSVPSATSEFSDLARFLDEMHDTHNCLFVIASGNHQCLQKWPQNSDFGGKDRVSSPGDSIRALTVGSIANNHNAIALSKSEEPSPFSRRGPGPCFVPKPDLSHYGGNCAPKGIFAQIGILSIGPNNTLCETLGTSFATPLVSAQAANLWMELDSSEQPSSPERIKALMIHSALVSSDKITSETVNHYGFGKPGDVIDSLYCDPNSITLMFEADLRHGGFEFERWPFPIADCLHTQEGKFRGEILMTVAYSPIVDQKYKSEYCRTNVDVGMGSYHESKDDTNKREFKSIVPVAPSDMKQLYEKAQIENGFKWSPVKAYYAKFPRGKEVDTWRLKMKVTRRAELIKPDYPQRATLLLTIRSTDSGQPVYNETIKLLNQSGWVMNDINQHVRIKVKS